MTQLAFFNAGRDDFVAVEEVADGLGPRMNLDACESCHSQPMVGGTSPAVNPQVAFATENGATNSIPSFITANGPAREARFVSNPDGSPDGGVHNFFTIAGRTDAPGCVLAQPDFAMELDRNLTTHRLLVSVASGGGVEWTEVTGTSVSAAVNNGYILNNAGLVTLTIPTTAAVGDVLRVVGKGAGGFTIAQNTSESINYGDNTTTTGTGGSLSSTHRYDAVDLVCVTANTVWNVTSSIGNLTVV
jgi:hypothetical protein